MVVMKPGREYVATAFVLVLIGVAAGQLLVRADVTYKPAAGVSVFAVLYVLAQGVERVVEFIIGAVTALDKDFAENRKRNALASLAAAGTAAPGSVAPAAADPETEKKAKEARLDIGVLAQGLAFAFAYSFVSYFEFGIFQTIGVENMADGADRALTAVAVMGGAKGLHDLIGKVQKSKEASEAAAA